MDIDNYLDTLFKPAKGEQVASAGPGPKTLAQRSASAVQKQWEQIAGTADLQVAEDILQRQTQKGLVDLLGADAAVGLASSLEDLKLVDNVPPASSTSTSDPLLNKVKAHLTTPSAYTHLVEVVSSSRSNEDIQSELVEIIGFEGDGLELVEAILRPGARALFAAESKKTQKSGPITVASSAPPVDTHRHAGGQKKSKKGIDISDLIGSNEDIERRIQEQLARPKAMFAEDGGRVAQQEVLPNVFTSSATVSSSLSLGGRFALPVGTEREMQQTYEEVTVPPPVPVPPKITERPVLINSLPPLARGCFPGYSSLNRMQSVVQPTAMNTNENLLICAPTGAGKTDVAIMSIIRVLQSHVRPGVSTHPSGFNIDRDAFKIIYVAPMKALAAEITRKFGRRLAWLGIKVRELTGDMQMTRQEIAETQVIVTTPEKWDVVTRKPTGEGELASKVKLLIIDEVHLLNEDRGAVIETIVARTLRQVESSQSLIRIVGLSATLPNYVDVSDFLRVNRYQGLFFFDSSFRPVPLEQHFIGVKGKARSQTSMRNMDQVVFDKVIELVREGHQVMVFVHARKETVKTAQKLKEMAQEEGVLEYFDTRDHPKFQLYRRDVGTSRNKEMKELFDSGFGIHHAGMLRSDRNMMERMFEDNCMKVLCCTSTLAWGVNLPAHAVVIKGTQVYDSGKGSFVDLSVLDVLQIFGRAGRPGYATSGVGYICTTQDKLDHYLYSIMSQHPIESKFIPGMVDSLNAEIALGTISNVSEAISWIGYTYLFVRMRREPFIYGMAHDEPKDDPQLGNKRNELVTQAARQLVAAQMITFDEMRNTFAISDLGRIAAKYYLRHQTVEKFNEKFKPTMLNADIFAMLAEATEFDQIQMRDNEVDELTTIMTSDQCPIDVAGGTSTAQGKVNILLQAHISKVFIEDFALVSDAAYVAQNAGRIIRALLEIALYRNWANCAYLLIDLSKAIERRIWPYDHPLVQITTLHKDTLYNLHRWAEDTEISELRELDAKALGTLIHMNEYHGSALHSAAWNFPLLEVEYALRPLAHDLLQISVRVKPQFVWSAKLSSTAEPFYVWIQDEQGLHLLQWRSVLLRQSTDELEIDFVVPWGQNPPEALSVITVSDRWLGSESQTAIPLNHLVMPRPFTEQTPLLDVPYLTVSCLKDPELEKAYRAYIGTLNGIQSQVFWSMYNTQNNVLVSAPVASGKSLLGEVAIWHMFNHNSEAVALVVVPQGVAEAAARIRSVTPPSKKITISTARNASDLEKALAKQRSVIVASPAAFVDTLNEELVDLGRKVSLVLLEDLHLLDPVYELTVAKLLSVAGPARTRVVGLTSSLSDPSDLGKWLGVDPAYRYCFSPQQSGTPIVVQTKTFTIPHSATLIKTMVKPTYDILRQAVIANSNAIIFVPSRGFCRTVAADLVRQSGTEMDLAGFLSVPRADVEPMVQRVRDTALYEPILHGIGYVYSGMAPSDFALVLELFAGGIIRALVAPRESCWTLPVRAAVVILMGAQHTIDRQAIAYTRQEIVKMQGSAAGSAAATRRMYVLCQAEQELAIKRLLHEGLPLESSLTSVIKREARDGRNKEGVAYLERMLKPRDPPPPPQHHRPRVSDLRPRDLFDLVGWTYLALRLRSNPTYYDMVDGLQEEQLSRLVDVWVETGETKKVKKVSKENGNGSGGGEVKGKGKEKEGEKQGEVTLGLENGGEEDGEKGGEEVDNVVTEGDLFEIAEVGMADGESWSGSEEED